jgi:protein involved in polysaccharide export with SLBB domain
MNKYIISSIFLVSTLFSQSMIPANLDLDEIKEQLKADAIISTEEISDIDVNQEEVVIEKIEEDNIVPENLNYYGYEYFSREINFFDNIPTPSNFKLGSGDEIILSLWGKQNSREKFIINKEGLIYYKNIGFINLSNKTIEEAERLLVSKLSTIYSTLKEDNKSTDLMLELGKLKSLNIYFSGEIKNPGIHLVHPFSDVFSAIAQAGGVKIEGSLRKIQIIRDGNILRNIDFYDFFSAGNDSFSNTKLIDGDVIHIPVVKNRVQLLGEVVRSGFYETVKGESLSDLINYAAGLTALASPTIIVDTIVPIESRQNNDSAISSMIIDLRDSQTISLNNGTLVTIQSIGDISSKVEIFGRVKNPGEYPAQNMSLKKLLDIAGGFDDPIFRKTIRDEIIVLRQDESQFYSKEINISYENAAELELKVNDKIFIYEDINYRNSFIYTMAGEVVKPGVYPLRKGITVGQAIELAGGLTELTSERHISLKQEITEIDDNGEVLTIESDVNNLKLDFEIGINSIITASPLENIIRVEGNVYNPGLITYRKGAKLPRYIELAGGYKPNSIRNRVYIKRANGNIEQANRIVLGIGKNLYPGDTIIVPVNENPSEFNVAAFTADILTVLSNLAAILLIVDNNNN